VIKLANPAPLGLFGFAVTTIMLSLFNVKIYGPVQEFPILMVTAFAFGGTAQFLAGLLEYPRGNTFGTVAFCSYGSFWWAFALYISGAFGKVALGPLGAWLVVWAAFTFVLFLATLKTGGRALQLVFLTLWIAFLLLGLSHLLNMDILHDIGGWIGFACGLVAFYLASAQVLNETYEKTVLPV
jgi:succinate-acetate transporter protein